MSLMKIYWVLFSSCLTTSREASWILNSAGNTAHLLFLKVSTVWNGRISLLKAALPHTDWGLSSPFFPFLPKSERQHHLASLGGRAGSYCCRRHFCGYEACWCKSLVGGCVVQGGHCYSDINSWENKGLGNLLNCFISFAWHFVLILILI